MRQLIFHLYALLISLLCGIEAFFIYGMIEVTLTRPLILHLTDFFFPTNLFCYLIIFDLSEISWFLRRKIQRISHFAFKGLVFLVIIFQAMFFSTGFRIFLSGWLIITVGHFRNILFDHFLAEFRRQSPNPTLGIDSPLDIANDNYSIPPRLDLFCKELIIVGFYTFILFFASMLLRSFLMSHYDFRAQDLQLGWIEIYFD
jgi:hypothetical protein